MKNIIVFPFRILSKLNPFRINVGYKKEFIFIIICGICIFFIISVLSFSPLDNSSYSYSFPEHYYSIQNLGGKIGIILSSHAIYYFGIFSLFIPIALIGLFFSFIFHHSYEDFKAQVLGWLLSGICVLYFLHFYVSSISFNQHMIYTTGLLGYYFYSWCIQWFGNIGSLVLISSLGLAGIVLILKLNWIFLLVMHIRKYYTYLVNKIIAIFNFYIIFISNILRINKISKENLVRNQKNYDLEHQSHSITSASLQSNVISSNRDVSLEETEATEIMHVSDLNYICPPISIFKISSKTEFDENLKQECNKIAAFLKQILQEFDIYGEIVGIQHGPVVTVYEFELASGTKISKITSLIDDIALALKVDSIFIHPSKGKRAVGIQVPNSVRFPVFLGDILNSEVFKASQSPLTFAIGKSITGEPVCVDLCQMPHLLIAGATGSGKSVAINSLLCSVITKSSPQDVRMILVDPKMLELSVYEGIPHLLMPVITEPYKASLALKWATSEMERRYKLMQTVAVRHITGFNAFWDKCDEKEKHKIKNMLEEENIGKMPYILLVIDELSDLMLTAPKDVESSIQRLAQKARACGIHLVLATQRPSVDVITGVIKANLPFRIAFQVVSKHDSRTILDQIGADKLLGKGDMLFQMPGNTRLQRLQGAFVSDEEVLNLVNFLKKHYNADYDDELIEWIEQENAKVQENNQLDLNIVDSLNEPKFDQAVQLAKTYGVISASFLQRYLKIGYNRAARIVEAMEAKGLVSKADGSKPRKWLGDNNHNLSL